MAYDDLKAEMGKRQAVFVELYLDRCINTYGSAPCTASGPAALKCFNTLATCQDAPNFDRGTTSDRKVYRFSNVVMNELQRDSTPFVEGDAPTFPILTRIDYAPTKLAPGKGLGQRAVVTATLANCTWSDVGCDPYLGDRTVDFEDQGTLLGRLIARNKFFQNRTMIVHQGYLEDDGSYDASNFKTRTYLIGKITGPDSTGTVVVEGRDPLRLADNEKKQWPRVTQAELSADINESVLTFDISDSDGEINTAYGQGQPWIRIDDEILEISTTPTDNGGGFWTISVTQRGDNPPVYPQKTTAETHDEEATVQSCWYFEDEPVANLVYFLLNTGAEIDSSFLPLSDWEFIVDSRGLINYEFTRLIVEPIGIKSLLDEICQHSILIWWDDREQEVKLDALVPSNFRGTVYNDQEHIIAGSVGASINEKNRLTQVWVYLGERNPILDSDKLETYQRVEIRGDLEAEGPEKYDDSKVNRIFSRWLPLTKRSVGGEIASRMLSEYVDSKKTVVMSLDPKDDERWTGDRVRIETRFVEDTFGAADAEKGYRVLQVDEMLGANGTKYKYLLQETKIVNSGLITPDDDPENPGNPFPDYSAASDDLKELYAFVGYDDGTGPPPEPEDFPDGEPPYEIL